MKYYSDAMPRKISHLLSDLREAGFYLLRCKGSHRTFKHSKGRQTFLSYHKESEDAKPYQEKQVEEAIDDVS
jgi:predicted RNA binding protein YcfA (HicA-like mRNA interferase family)